jgi:hypothetical protein
MERTNRLFLMLTVGVFTLSFPSLTRAQETDFKLYATNWSSPTQPDKPGEALVRADALELKASPDEYEPGTRWPLKPASRPSRACRWNSRL